MSQNEHIITLIAKQLQGLATPQEAEELQQWMQSDASRRQEYDDIVMIWQKSGPLLANTPKFERKLPGLNWMTALFNRAPGLRNPIPM